MHHFLAYSTHAVVCCIFLAFLVVIGLVLVSQFLLGVSYGFGYYTHLEDCLIKYVVHFITL